MISYTTIYTKCQFFKKNLFKIMWKIHCIFIVPYHFLFHENLSLKEDFPIQDNQLRVHYHGLSLLVSFGCSCLCNSSGTYLLHRAWSENNSKAFLFYHIYGNSCCTCLLHNEIYSHVHICSFSFYIWSNSYIFFLELFFLASSSSSSMALFSWSSS